MALEAVGSSPIVRPFLPVSRKKSAWLLIAARLIFCLTNAVLLNQAGDKLDKHGSDDFHEKNQQKSAAENSFAKLGEHKEPPSVVKSLLNFLTLLSYQMSLKLRVKRGLNLC